MEKPQPRIHGMYTESSGSGASIFSDALLFTQLPATTQSSERQNQRTLGSWTGLLLWGLPDFPILAGDKATWKSPYLSPWKPKAWSHPTYPREHFYNPSPSPACPHLDRLPCVRSIVSLPSSYWWECSLWGSWSPGREGYEANRQTVLGQMKQSGEEGESEMLWVHNGKKEKEYFFFFP